VDIGTVAGAAQVAGVDRSMHYTWLETDPTYPSRFEHAHQAMIDSIVADLRRMARSNPVPAMFLLKRHRPEYRDNYKVEHEHSGPGGGPLEVTVKFVGTKSDG
jgi:hypothetical protein